MRTGTRNKSAGRAKSRARSIAPRQRPRARVKTAEDISWQALELAEQARAAGLTELCHLLESVALSAAAEAAASRWPEDSR